MLENLNYLTIILFSYNSYTHQPQVDVCEITVFDVLKRASCKSTLYNKSKFRTESRLKRF